MDRAGVANSHNHGISNGFMNTYKITCHMNARKISMKL